MRKSKWLVGILMVSLMLMGAGYAAWSQGFTVTSRADTGEMKVQVVDDEEGTEMIYVDFLDSEGEIIDPMMIYSGHTHGAFTNWVDYVGSDPEFIGGTMGEVTCMSGVECLGVVMLAPADKESLTFELSKAFPGLGIGYEFDLINSGTVPVILTSMSDDCFVGQNKLSEALIEAGYFECELTPMVVGSTLVPGGHMAYKVEFTIDPEMPILIEYEGVEYNTMNQKLIFEITFNFDQGI